MKVRDNPPDPADEMVNHVAAGHPVLSGNPLPISGEKVRWKDKRVLPGQIHQGSVQAFRSVKQAVKLTDRFFPVAPLESSHLHIETVLPDYGSALVLTQDGIAAAPKNCRAELIHPVLDGVADFPYVVL